MAIAALVIVALIASAGSHGAAQPSTTPALNTTAVPSTPLYAGVHVCQDAHYDHTNVYCTKYDRVIYGDDPGSPQLCYSGVDGKNFTSTYIHYDISLKNANGSLASQGSHDDGSGGSLTNSNVCSDLFSLFINSRAYKQDGSTYVIEVDEGSASQTPLGTATFTYAATLAQSSPQTSTQ